MDKHIRLKKGDLSVALCVPEQVYNGARFDHSVIIDEIIWKGHSFASVELPAGVEGQTTDGVGIIGEIKGPEEDTLKVDELGSRFMKLGVGTMINDRPGKYNFFHPYPIAESCRYTVQTYEDRAVIIVEQPVCDGFSAVLVKDIRLQEDKLTVTATLINTGDRDIQASEYNHNFLLIDNLQLGDGGYELSLAEGLDCSGIAHDCIEVKDNTLYFTASPDVYYFSLGPAVEVEDERWCMRARAAGVGVRETGAVKVEKMDLWGKAHVMSAEAYINCDVPAGGSTQWQRNWEFFCL